MTSINYSKWDKIELSDDEDFECHPNVDKKSMVRWKQAQIHKERREREDQRDLLKMEYDTTEKFLAVMPPRLAILQTLGNVELVQALDLLGLEIDQTFTDPMRQESMKRMKNWPSNWETPVWGDVLKNHVPWNEEINAIILAANDKLAADKDADLRAIVAEMFNETLSKLVKRQPIIKTQLDVLEKEMNKKLTSDHLIEVFNKTFVAKPDVQQKTTKVIETIHTPKEIAMDDEESNEIFEEMQTRDEDMKEHHPHLLEFSQKESFGDIVHLLRKYPALQNEKFEEVLLLRALCLSATRRMKEARSAVQVSLIIKYTRSLGPSGVDLFFTKLTGAGSSAQNLFFNDLNTTYDHISKRGGVLRQERLDKKKEQILQETKKKEIYESFKQPDGTLMLPLGPEPSESELKQKEWFDNLPEDYKQGLLLEDVEKINNYLSSLDPEEAEHQAKIAEKSGFVQFESAEEGEE